MSTRIVILTASSGGGHNAAACALQTLIKDRLRGDCEFSVIDVYQKNLFQRLPVLAKIRYHSDSLWRVFLYLTNHKAIARSIARLMRPFMIRSIAKQLPEHSDYIIAVHFNPTQHLPQLAKLFSIPPKTAIVATDLDPHWAWFGCNADAMYVSSEAGHKKALISGYQPHQIFTLSLIPTEKIAYRTPSNKSPSRKKLGIVSGQDGSNPRQIQDLLGTLADLPHATEMDVTVFCGTNTNLHNRLTNDIDLYAPLSLDVQGYTDNLKSHFHHYDLMLIRTSPGILSECICAGVPVIGFDWSAHEQYQQQFIQMHDIGFASKAITELRTYVYQLLTQPQILLDLQKNVSRLRRQNDTNAMLTHLLKI